jgi:isocitrate dehydrogenase
MVGLDLFVHWRGDDINDLGTKVDALSTDTLALTMLSCKGLKVWPNIVTEMDFTDRFRARFMPRTKGATITHADVADLLNRAAKLGIDFLKIETLFTFDGKAGFSASQGE